MEQIPVVTIVIILFVLFILSSAIRILREYERGVIFRLGRLIGGGGIKGPGLILLIPIIDKMVKVSLRTVVFIACLPTKSVCRRRILSQAIMFL